MRVTVVGAGIMGLSTAWALVRRGHEVSVVEQGPVPNPLGSSVDQHRLIRFPYGDMAGYTAMVGPALAAWERLWTDLDERLYRETGTLILGSEGHPWVEASAAALADQGIPYRELDPSWVPLRFPVLRADGLARAIHLDSGGVLLAGRIVAALARRSTEAGVTILEHTPAGAVDTDDGTVHLADGSRLGADRVVVAAGPWVGRLLPDLHRRVTPSRQVVAYVAPPTELATAWEEMPMVLDLTLDRIFYVVPPVMGTGLKIGDHGFSMSGEPDVDRSVGDEETEALLAPARRRLAGIDRYRVDGAKSCFYTVEPEERFLVEPVGAAGLVLAGFSGHGFKFGPLIGEAAADLLDGRRAPADVTRWAAGLPDPGDG